MTALCPLGLNFPSLQGCCCWPEKAGQRGGSVPAVLLLPVLTTHKCHWSIPRHSSLCTSLFSGIFCHLQDLFCSQHLYFFPDSLLNCFRDSHFFPWALIFGMEPKASGFPPLNGLHTEAQHMISLVVGGNVSYLFISQAIQDMPLLFSLNVIKIYN